MSGLIEFREKLERSWDKETTYSPEEYEDEDPSYGQCAVTAVLLQDEFGGQLMRAWAVNKDARIRTRHYWNRLLDYDIDLTWRQFPAGTKLIDIETANRKQLLANKWMKERYEKLKANYLDN